MYSGIELPFTIAAAGQPAMPVEQIRRHASFRGWLQADAKHMVLDGSDVVSISGPGEMVASQPTSTSRGQIAAASAPNGYSSLRLSLAETSRYPITSGSVDTAAPWSMVMLVKPDAPNGSTQIVAGRFTNSTVRAVVTIPASGSNLQFLYKSSTLNIPITSNAWNLVTVAWSGSHIKGRSNGVRATDVASASADTSAAVFTIGGPASGTLHCNANLSDLILFGADVFDAAQADLLTTLAQYFDAAYGLDL